MFYSLNCRGTLLDLSQPVIMGVLNLTPDSFFDGGKYNSPGAALAHTRQMLTEGAHIIDIGGYSSRPGAQDISVDEELSRVVPVIQVLKDAFPEAIFSIDTFRATVAAQALQLGVQIVNDISGGNLDDNMISTVASFPFTPYIMMHMQGTPQTMQLAPGYDDVVAEVKDFFVGGISLARQAGIHDIVIDPGFGFGKTLDHNYQLLAALKEFSWLDVPIMVGLSRKSMIYKLIDIKPEEAGPLSAILHYLAASKGAHILRVHDVRATVQTLKLRHHLAAYGVV